MLGRLVLHRKCGAFRFSDEQYCRFVKEVEELAVVQEELQRKKQIAGSTEVLLTADNLQQYVKKIEVDRGKITYTEFLL